MVIFFWKKINLKKIYFCIKKKKEKNKNGSKLHYSNKECVKKATEEYKNLDSHLKMLYIYF
jgi:hypothetical protein